MTEIEFIQRANIIIEDCGCRAILIDTDNRNIEIECQPGKDVECAQALASQIGDYE